MITAIGFVPMPPLLRPEVASGAAAELDDVRASIDALLTELSSVAASLVVIAPASGGDLAQWIAARPANASPFQLVTVPDEPESALSDAAVDAIERLTGGPDVALLVLGDGTACRSLKAPGYLDERAIGFDDGIRQALAAADSSALVDIDQQLAAQLQVAGRATWPIAGRVTQSTSWSGSLLNFADPYGVAYFVALWLPANDGIPKLTT